MLRTLTRVLSIAITLGTLGLGSAVVQSQQISDLANVTGRVCQSDMSRVSLKDGQASCDPNQTAYKSCDEKYTPASPGWGACHAAVVACFAKVEDDNKIISNYNGWVAACQSAASRDASPSPKASQPVKSTPSSPPRASTEPDFAKLLGEQQQKADQSNAENRQKQRDLQDFANSRAQQWEEIKAREKERERTLEEMQALDQQNRNMVARQIFEQWAKSKPDTSIPVLNQPPPMVAPPNPAVQRQQIPPPSRGGGSGFNCGSGPGTCAVH